MKEKSASLLKIKTLAYSSPSYLMMSNCKGNNLENFSRLILRKNQLLPKINQRIISQASNPRSQEI